MSTYNLLAALLASRPPAHARSRGSPTSLRRPGSRYAGRYPRRRRARLARRVQGTMPDCCSGTPQALLEMDADIAWPEAETWAAQLMASRWVATPDDPVAASDPHARWRWSGDCSTCAVIGNTNASWRKVCGVLPRIESSVGDSSALDFLFARSVSGLPPSQPSPASGEGLKTEQNHTASPVPGRRKRNLPGQVPSSARGGRCPKSLPCT